MDTTKPRRSLEFRPTTEAVEGRQLLNATPALISLPGVPGGPLPLGKALHATPGYSPVRPNTPVLPIAADFSIATFIDPTVRVVHGQSDVIGSQDYIAPFATLNSASGFIKIGSQSTIQDNATILANPNHLPGTIGVVIGNGVVIGVGATVQGPSTIGAFGDLAKPTYIGPNAVVDGATIKPGAYVSTLARVGPGVTLPAGFKVLPGQDVTTDAEASDPKLGKVVAVTPADLVSINSILGNSVALALGYTTLYQGNSATGPSRDLPASNTTIFNGNLAAVSGTSKEPGKDLVSFEPAKGLIPKFPSPHRGLIAAALPHFRARVIGQASFNQRAYQVAHHLGPRNTFRADVGQPITFGSIDQTGKAVSIRANKGGKITIGQNFRADNSAVILGGSTAPTVVGDNVTIGAGAVVDQSTIGNNATIGARSNIKNSKVPAGTVVPPGTILINNKRNGTVQS